MNSQSASISGIVFLDVTGSNVFGGTDSGFANVPLSLLDDTGAVIATTTSDSNGAYSFVGLAPGQYAVQPTPPSGMIADTAAPVQLTVGTQTITGQNIGLYKNAEAAGFVVADVTGSGTQSDVDGVTVQLVDAGGNVVATSTSGPLFGFPHGIFDFHVKPGSYLLDVVVPGAKTQAPPTSITLTSGQVLGGLVLGVPNPAAEAGTATASISGFAYNDTNSNGLFDGQETVIDGETVQLLDPTGDPIATTVTGKVNGIDGAYAFTGLTPGQYGVRFTPPAGTIATTPVLLPLGNLSAGANVTINAGSVPSSGTIDIAGTAFNDVNENGVLDGHEAGLAGVDVVLINNAGTSSARAVETVVTDAQGSYNFIGLAPGTYAVSVATPSGDVATTPTSFNAGPLALGNFATFNPGFAPNPSPAATPIPASTTLNIILRGQSNAQYFVQYGTLAKLQTDLQTLLGFDGTNQKVNIVADFFQADGVNTINSGTAMVGNWVTPIGGDYTKGWSATPLELGLLSEIADQSAAFKAAPTAILWLHNETDSVSNPNITAAEWESAARYEAGLVRGVLGQTASAVPYLFVDAIPFPSNGAISSTASTLPPVTGAVQQIRIGMAALAADPAFNGVIAAQASDVNMDSAFPGNSGTPNGAHMGLADMQILEQRLLASLADTFAASALPGSPLALAGGSVDNLGPQVVTAAAIAGQPNSLLLTVQLNQATTLEALASTYAQQGGGWTIRTSAATDSTLEASGTAAKVINSTQILVTFDQAVPTSGELFYAWGSGRLATSVQPGEGNAVYDNNNLPIWADPNGVAIAAASTAQPGSIAGVVYFDANGNAVFDTGDTAIPGAAVNLLDTTGATVASATTGADGSYTFANVQPGEYSVSFPAVSGATTSGGTGNQTVVVTSGQAVTGIDGGYYVPGSILGVGFIDTAGTGHYAGSGGVDGEQVQLLNAAGAVIATTVTSNTDAAGLGVDGVYSFTNLAPGSYTVAFTPPAADILVSPASVAVTLNQGYAEVDSILAAAPAASVAGTAFLDSNGNGAQDSGETGIAGVAVTLANAAGITLATTTTDSSGHYTFDAVATGTDTISFATPAGDVADASAPLNVTVGTTNVTGANAGFYQGAQVAGFVADPTSGAYIDGITVTLLDSTGAAVATTTSGPLFGFPHGIFDFAGLKPGVYSIATQRPGSTVTSAPQSTGPLVSGQTLGGVLVQAPPAATGSITGTAFLDANGNGTQDSGETGIAGVAVTLADTAGTALATTTTDRSGNYSFANLAAGKDTVSFVPPSGDTADASAPLNVTVGTGAVTGENAGFYQNAQVVGFVEDQSGNPVDGITVNLLDATGTVVATTISSAQFGLPHGVYYFPAVKPGVYTVQSVLVSGTVTEHSSVSTGQLTGGQFLTGLTVTLPPPSGGSIKGTVFFDATGNDVFGGADIGLSGVAVSLLDANGAQVATATTSANGTYTFQGLADGVYSVTFGSPAGTPISTIYGTMPSDITNNETNNTQHVSISGANSVTSIDAGYSFPITIQGYAFNDVNGNGTFGGGDTFVAGETVTLLDGARDQVGQAQTTGANGYYSFTNIPQGPYTLEFSAPAGTVLTTPVLDYVGVIAGGQTVTVNSGSVSAVGSISVSGTVFTDHNADAIQEAGDTGLAGVNVLLLKDAGTPNATALRTVVTGADGSYSFIGLPAGNYSVVVSTPEGLTGTSLTTAAVGALVSGQSGTADFGFATNPSPDVTSPPASTMINIILRGQSNAQYFAQGGYLVQLQQAVEKLLGFDGVNQVVNILGDYGKGNGDNTINSGTGMTTDWLSQNNGGYANGWTAKNLELGLLSDIAQQSAAFKASPTAVVWLHNESDSDVAGLTTPEWQSAAQFEAGLVRGLLGQGASSVPYMFVDAIPFISAFGVDQAGNNSNDQAIKIGMYGLANDPAFGGTIAAQSADVNMDHDGSIGGAHLDGVDDANLVNRLAQSIAAEFASSALPGSPVAAVNGNLDDLGPQVVSAQTVASNPNQLLLTIKQDNASGFEALAAAAAAGVGWSIRNTADGSSSVLEASGTAAQIVDGTHILVTFDQAVPANGLLFYSWGSARLAANATLPGQGNAVYDINAMPIWTDPNGVAINAATAQPGSIAGFAYLDANGNAVLDTADTPIPGFTVDLADSTGKTIATTVTGTDGSYAFANLQPGAYSVVFPVVSGLQTSGATGSLSVTLASGQNVTGIDGGLYFPESIAGVGFIDTAGTGQYAGTGGVDGEQVQLLNAAGTVIATTTTSNTVAAAPGIDGVFSFANLAPGTYSLHFTPPAGDILTSAATVPVTLSGGGAFVTSILAAATGSIAGTAFLDADGNGTQDSGETGIAGVAVTLESAAGATLGTTTTDASGNYSFTGLAAGTDTVSFATPNGDIADTSAPLSVTVGNTAVTGQSAGFYKGAAIAGFVQDPSGNPQDGVVVNLVDGAGAIVATTSSGPNPYFPHGVYEFDNVRPGTYKVQIAVPGVSSQTEPSTGALVSGQNLFGFNLTMPAGGASISGTTFTDTNGDGTLRTGETGLAGVNLVLIKDPGTSNATALATLVSDAQGHYDFSGLVAGNYAVVAATPLGLQGTSATNVSVSALADGQTATANVGFATNPTPDATSLPASTTLNIVLRGQSNATYFMQAGFLTKLQQDVEKLLGFDGINQTINIVGDTGNPTDSTLYPGTGLTTDWLSQINGSYTNGWTANSQELGLLTDLARQSAAFKTAPTAILYLHNESDALSNPNLTVAQWQSAVQFEAGLVRGILGQSASTTPYQFVDAIPFVNIAGVPIDREDQANQSIRLGMYGFTANPEFNASIVAQTSDVDMNHDGPNGGAHLNTGGDDTQLESRLAQSLAVTFAASALPGSAVALANGNLDDKGPQVVAAAAVAGNLHQLLITVTQDQASGFLALDATAAQGVGWSIRGSAVGATSALEASGTAAQLIDPTHILLTFDQPIPPGGSLFYAWGAARLSTTSTSPGEGNAIYDTNSMPIWADPNGVAITGTAPLPPGSISGTAFNDANANGILDSGDGGLSGVSVTLTDASGTALATVTTDGSGNYRFYGLAAGNYTVGFTAPPGDGVDTAATLPVAVGTSAVTGQNVGVWQGAQVAGFVTDPTSGADLDGITVNLLDATGAVAATTTSGPLFGFPHGVFDFAGVKPDTYSIETQRPGGTTTSTPQSLGQLVSGQNLVGLTIQGPAAGAAATGSITGAAFLDANGNGTLDTGEIGIAGDSVTLVTAAGATVATTTTDSSGNYRFTGVASGAYTVAFATPSGDTLDTPATLPVAVGTSAVTGQNVGAYQGAQVAGFVTDPVSGADVDGVTVNLLDATGAIVATTVSGPLFGFPHGIFDFTGVKPGPYSIETQLPGGTATSTPQSVGPLVSGQILGGLVVQAPVAPAATGSIAGTAFLDANGNGTQDSGESGIAGISVTLTSAAGAMLATTTTHSAGNYSFTGLAAGTDTVSFSTPSGDSAENTTPLSVSISAGQQVTNTNAAFYVGAAIAGFVEDTSGTPTDGVTVNLLDGTGAVVATMASGPNFAFAHGVYEFQNVKPGTYSIQAVVPGGQTQPTFSTGVITGGQNLFGFNINLLAPPPTGPSLSGTVFNDANLNNVQDSGEVGIAGDIVTLINAAGATVATKTTDSTGAYDFTGLTTGSYAVEFATPGGYRPDNQGPFPVTLASQGAATENAGFYQPAAVAGFVFADTNGDGAMNGAEAGLDGITVNLIDNGGAVVATTTSGPYLSFPHGVYVFNNVEPGTYAVQTFGTGVAPVSTGALVSGQALYGFNIAVKDTAPVGIGSIAGTAFIDNGGSKTFVLGDAGLAGETITLLSSSGTPLASVATDANGTYSFGNLADGNYSVSFARPSGYADNAVPAAVPVIVANGQAVSGVDSGFHAAVTIQGLAFIDKDNTGQFVTGETLVNGVTVTLLNHDHDPVARTVTATVNGADGVYSFTDVAPGIYTVRFDAPSGDVLTTPTLNSLGALAAGQSIALNSGMVSSAGTITVSGTAFSDTNGDGRQDAGEIGLGGATVLLMKDAGTANATAVKTLVTDADGGYAFANLVPGTYSVAVATPAGLASTSATNVSVGALTTGQSGTVDVGFTTNPSPAVTPVPPSTTLNIVLIGQSNAQNIANPAMSPGLIASMQSQLQQLLGFDGVNQKVNILADFGKANGDNTINSGTGITTDWLSQINGSYTNGWSANSLELGYLSDLSQQAATFQGAPTAIVMLHNEADSNNPYLTLPEWESAVQFEAGLTRAVLGESASSVPWLFVNAIPFPGGGSFQDSNEQTIRIGQAALSADPTFGGTVAAQASDITENEFGTPPLGGHLNLQDRELVVSRVVQTLADTFASSALPGSPIALANGHIDDKGPQVVGAQTVVANTNQLLLTVKQDTATAFEALGAQAATGVGWSIRNTATGPNSTLEASGTAAQIIDGTHILVTFDKAVPAGGLLFYAYGQGLIAQPGQSGYGNAVYDTNNLPISANPNGVTITVPDTTAPVVTASAGTASVQATSASGAAETFAASVTDAVDGTSDAITFTEQLAGGATKTVHSGDTFALGTHTIIASARDAAGNTGSAAPFSFGVVDTTAPVVTASAVTASVQATSASGAAETFAASVTDAVDGTSDAITFTEQLAGGATKIVHSGDTFAIGTHTIIASATDAAGNTGSAAPFSFGVVDTTAPVVTASAVTASVQATSASGAAETFAASVTDAVDGTSDAITFTEQLAGGATKTVHSGDTFALGTHTIIASARDAAGNTGSAAPFSFGVTPGTSASVSGRTVDGYIAGATVFVDTNGNGVLDPGEASAVTDTQGFYNLASPGAGSIVVEGGIDTATKLPFTGTMSAPSGSSVVSPLTTLVDQVAQTNGGNVAAAEAMVKASLGIASDVDLGSLDPVAATLAGQSNAAAVFAAGAAVLDTVTLLKAAGATGNVFGALAQKISEGGTINLGDSATILGVAQAAGVGAAAAAAASQIAAASNAVVTAQAGSGSSLLTAITALSIVSQGTAAASLQAAGSDSAMLAQVTAANTGANLTAAASAARSNVGTFGQSSNGAPATLLWTYEDTAYAADPLNGATYLWSANGSQVAATSSAPTMGPNWTAAGSGDFLGDGGTDVLWRYQNGANPADPLNGSMDIWKTSGTSVTDKGMVSSDPGQYWDVAATGDFNGDGRTDILLRYDDTANASDVLNGSTEIMMMNGTSVASVQPTSVQVQNPDWQIAGSGDFNGDGKADILWRYDDTADQADTLNGATYIWRMDGATVASQGLTSEQPGSAAWTVAGIGDFSGDGKSDILFRYNDGTGSANGQNGETYIFEQGGVDGTVTTGAPTAQQVDLSWVVAGVADFNGDGHADILFRNASNPGAPVNATYEWQMNGNNVAAQAFTSSQVYDGNWHPQTLAASGHVVA